MRLKNISIGSIVIVLLTGTASLQADDEKSEHVWMLKKPGSEYWQVPEQSGTDTAPDDRPSTAETGEQVQELAREPATRDANIPPLESRSDIKHATPVPPAPQGPYTSGSMVPDNAASAYFLPGYHHPEHHSYLRSRSNYGRYNPPRNQRAPGDFRRHEPYRLPPRHDDTRRYRSFDRPDSRSDTWRRHDDRLRPSRFERRDDRWDRDRDSWRNDSPRHDSRY